MPHMNINDADCDPDQEVEFSDEELAEAKALHDEAWAAYEMFGRKCKGCETPMEFVDWFDSDGMCDPCWRAWHDREMALVAADIR
jgi:hypothetical protein